MSSPDQGQRKHEYWSSQWLFVMATIGSSVGLANIWRFPFATGENGGGAFVLIYLAAVFIIALPLLIGELMLGRHGQSCPPKALKTIALESGGSQWWKLRGYMGAVTAVIILSYYCMIGGETLIYAWKNLAGNFVAIDALGSQAISNGHNASWMNVIAGHTIFLGIVIFISARGVSAGLEQAVKFMMPALFLILVTMVVYAAIEGDFQRTLQYLFSPDFSKINASIVVEAVGQAFFSVGVGITVLMAYGSYMHKDDSVTKSSVIVVGADSLVAILAGLAIFPIVFAYGQDAGGGPGLVFEVVPLAFGSMIGGQFLGGLFFVLMAFAAITSAISLLEAPVAWLESKTSWNRSSAAIAAGSAVWLLGLLPVFSLNGLAEFFPLAGLGIEKTFFDLFDYAASNLLLPLGGLFTAIFVGWVVPEKVLHHELKTLATHHWFRLWFFLIKYLVPFVLVVVFASLIL